MVDTFLVDDVFDSFISRGIAFLNSSIFSIVLIMLFHLIAHAISMYSKTIRQLVIITEKLGYF